MKHTERKRHLFLILSILAAVSLTGCGKKEKDPNASEVMKLQLTPEATPTPVPEDADPKAVSSKGSVKMVNEYLDQKLKEEVRAAEEEAAKDGEDAEEQDESNED